jgi:phosphatidylserine/phosphatidylglycerophosphate/cardiolipin synthase-like enzyme
MMALASQGVEPETVTAACEEAKRAKPGERIPPGFVLAILERWAREAAALKVNGAGQPRTAAPAAPAPPRKPTGTDPKGLDESYDAYQARINAAEAARRKGQP